MTYMTCMHRLFSAGVLGAGGLLDPRPSTRGGETDVDADGCLAHSLPWETREVESNTLTLKRLLPATNYMVREVDLSMIIHDNNNTMLRIPCTWQQPPPPRARTRAREKAHFIRYSRVR